MHFHQYYQSIICSYNGHSIVLPLLPTYAGASLNEESLRENGITHIINWSNSARCNVFDGIEYLCISGVKSGKTLITHLNDLDKAVDLVDSVRRSGGKILSHCWYGKNRSVTLLVA